MKSNQFQNLIRRVLKEEIETKNAIGGASLTRVPEMNSNGVDPEKKNKRFSTDSNTKDIGSKNQMLEELIKIVTDIDKDILVQWDDHDDLMVNARDLKFIRISPRWEDYFVIEMMTRNEDRIWVTGLNWEQVKEFVKVNLKELNKQPTAVDKAYDKSYRNRKDETQSPDKGLPQKDKPKILPLTNEPLKDGKKKEKDYTEKQVKKDDDLPEKPMKEVGNFKKLSDYKVKEPVKPKKQNLNTKLTIKS